MTFGGPVPDSPFELSHPAVPVGGIRMGPRKFEFEFRCGTDGCGHLMAGTTHLVIVETTGLQVRCKDCKAYYLVTDIKVYGPLTEELMELAVTEQAKRVARRGEYQ